MESEDKTRTRRSKPRFPNLIVVDSHGLYTFPKDVNVGQGIDSLEDENYFAVGGKCATCGSAFILLGGLEDVLHEERQMGHEIYYSYNSDFNCEECDAKHELEFDLTVYANGWEWQVTRRDSFTFLQIDGLEDVLGFLQRLLSTRNKMERLESRVTSLKFDRELLLKRLEEKPAFFLVLEGKDDLAVWEQLLRSKGAFVEQLAMMRYGDGGVDEAIKLMNVLHTKAMKGVPKFLVVDSDGDKPGQTKKLRDKGIKKGEFHVLTEKEIESYLIDPNPISKVLDITEEQAKKVIADSPGVGKEKLEAIFQRANLPKPDDQMKGLLARMLKPIPKELDDLIDTIAAKTPSVPSYLDEEERDDDES